ncbi:unnamed protein product [Closterium sp. Naga37s-1]|nr:unnamed protein product [Closterium sp. Naga37s-1]
MTWSSATRSSALRALDRVRPPQEALHWRGGLEEGQRAPYQRLWHSFQAGVNCHLESKTRVYIASLLRPVIDKVGPENVVAVCTDGGSNYASEARKIGSTWPHIEHVPCATHVMDMMMEDVGKMGWAKGLVEKGGMMINFVRNHHFTRAFMKKGGGKQVLKPAGTRFGKQYIALSRLCEVRGGLAQMEGGTPRCSGRGARHAIAGGGHARFLFN